MVEARWDDGSKTPAIDWQTSAALENVERGGQDIAEVTSLAQAIDAWRMLEPDHQAQAVLTTEHPVQFDGKAVTSFTGETLAALAERSPGTATPSDAQSTPTDGG